MHNIRSLTYAVCCLCLVAFAPSCSLKQWKADRAGQEHKIIDDTARQAQAHIALGNYKKAIELYSSACEKYHSPGMRSSFARTAEQIRNTADEAYQNKDFEEAGSIYHALFESGVATRNLGQSLSFDNDYLNRQLGLCSKGLMESGLMKYREEKLEEAIAIWKKALVLDPENKGIKKAVETATMQLQKLKTLK